MTAAALCSTLPPLPSGVSLRAATPADTEGVEALVGAAGLPVEGIAEHILDFVVAQYEGSIVGSAGLERYATTGLLRSVAVSSSLRGHGIGLRLAAGVIDAAVRLELRSLFLLTTTAATFFPRLGFERTIRDVVPPAIRASREFASICPSTAVVMRLELGPHAE